MTHNSINKISQKISPEKAKEYFWDFIFILAGSIIYSASVAVFTAPNNIAPGGITGIATILNYLIHTPIGLMYLILNIPLLVLSFKLISREFIVKTLLCTVLTSVFVDGMALFVPTYTHSMLLAALYGGILSGVGLGLVFLRGATSGGSDVISRLMRLKFKHVPMGKMMMVIDSLIVILSTFVFKSVDSGLYAFITIFTCSKVIDAMIYGSETGQMMLVISEKNEMIANKIMDELSRGVTMLKGRGFYTGHEKDVLMCTVRRPETAKLRSIVRNADPNAFIVSCEASEVIGEGFKPITKED
ncbi:MAG TPA: YitT family protein [Clostridia bacterium]|nr:YitT family protein [Clostridia bacterium]